MAAPREISAWIHVAEDGAVTVSTGKAELGQNIRTSLAQAVAEELHVPFESVRLVMADTARTPFDMGTFGSQTTPTMNRQLRRAAAAAREQLLDMAAERLAVARGELVAVKGAVTHAGSGRSLKYGELTRGQQLLKSIGEDQPLIPPDRWEVAGRSLPKVDGQAFVTGRHRYASDILRPRMWHGKVLRPPAIGGALAALDTAPAEAMPDVVVVHEGDFVGVAAPDELTAERALAAIRAEWKPAPETCSSRTLSEYLKAHAQQVGSNAGPDAVKEALASADVALSRTYTGAYIAHVPLEPRAAVAEWEGEKLTVWTGSQRPFGVRSELSEAFRLPAESVRVIVPDTGSGYGGKHTGDAAIEAARLARAAGRPIKRAWTREEEFTWAYFRPAAVIDASAGAKKDGSLTAWAFDNINAGGAGLASPYSVPHRHEASHNGNSPLRQGSYRALAATVNTFARESLMDELAHALEWNPLEFRRKNLTEPRLRAVLDAAAERFGWGSEKPGPDHGFGLACGAEKGSVVATCAEVAVDRSTRQVKVVRLVTAFECGAIVNPDHLTNQVQGMQVMALGGALFEAIRFDRGKIQNAKLSRYRVPRLADLPKIEVVLVNRKDLSPAGAGETPMITVAPAVANAIFDATGKRLRDLPLVPDGLKSTS
jgi:isoquinoline 1-oxidoreductase